MYKKMYYQLFNAITDALDALAQKNYGQAEELLKRLSKQVKIFIWNRA